LTGGPVWTWPRSLIAGGDKPPGHYLIHHLRSITRLEIREVVKIAEILQKAAPSALLGSYLNPNPKKKWQEKKKSHALIPGGKNGATGQARISDGRKQKSPTVQAVWGF